MRYWSGDGNGYLLALTWTFLVNVCLSFMFVFCVCFFFRLLCHVRVVSALN